MSPTAILPVGEISVLDVASSISTGSQGIFPATLPERLRKIFR